MAQTRFTEAETMEEAAARELLAELVRVKDELVSRLLARDSLSSTEVMQMRTWLRRVEAEGFASQIGDIFTRYQSWSWERGVADIDEYLGGADVAGVLKLPESSVAQLATYGATRIVTVAPEYLEDIARRISLAYTGQRTPQQVAQDIQIAYQRTAYRAETIVRTEVKTLQNAGAESRIKQAGAKSRELGIRSGRVWLHSSGKAEGFAKGKFRAKYDPRPHHKAMHGTVVEVDEKFTLTNPKIMTTWQIEGPHDDVLPAGEVVNCYCGRAFRLIEDTPIEVR